MKYIKGKVWKAKGWATKDFDHKGRLRFDDEGFPEFRFKRFFRPAYSIHVELTIGAIPRGSKIAGKKTKRDLWRGLGWAYQYSWGSLVRGDQDTPLVTKTRRRPNGIVDPAIRVEFVMRRVK